MPRHQHPCACYRIRIEERCGRWIEEVTGFSTETDTEGTTLSGTVRDPAALYGVIRHLRDMGLTLVSLARVSGETQGEE